MLVDKIKYNGQEVEAAWALGDAIAVMGEEKEEKEADIEAANEASGEEEVLVDGDVETGGSAEVK